MIDGAGKPFKHHPPYLKCAKCLTHRPPSALEEGRCKDTTWCEAQRGTVIK